MDEICRSNLSIKMYDVSVITATFNSAKTIEKAILSLQNSNNSKNLQHIFIDGGSTDETVSIIKKYLRASDKLISEKDKGISDAFNKGVLQSEGTYLHILNSDDWADPILWDILLSASKQMTAPMVHSDAQWWINGRKFRYAKGSDLYFDEMLLNGRMRFIQHGSMLIRRDVFIEIGLYSLDYKCIMDADWIYRATKSGYKSEYVPAAVINHNIGGTSFQFKSIIESYRLQKSSGIPFLKRAMNAARKTLSLAIIRTKIRLASGNWI